MRKLFLIAMLLAGCPQVPQVDTAMGDASAAEALTNRIDIPPQVVRNLGIEFAKVERRHVEQTLRYAGAFESLPEAERAYATPLAGRVELIARQYQSVQAGDLLARVDAPAWLEMRRGLTELDTAHQTAEAALAIARAEHATLRAERHAMDARMAAVAPLIQASHAHQANLILELEHWQAWASELEGIAEAAGGQAAALAEARGRVAAARSAITDEDEKCLAYQRELADLRALVSPLEHQVEAAASRVEAAEVALAGTVRALEAGRTVAAAMLGAKPGEADWTEQRYIEIRADTPGVVTRLHVQPGGRAGTDATLVETLDVGRVRFRARALQSDLGRLRDGLTARVVGPGGHEPAEGTLTIAPGANSEARTLELLLVPEAVPAWARPGVVGQLEVVWDRTSQAELAVPAAAVLRDGLEHVLFVRDPDDPNKVIRATPQLGPTDGRWRVVYSDVIAGDEVVVAGAYELKLTGAGQATQGGHFHADGTWHADAH